MRFILRRLGFYLAALAGGHHDQFLFTPLIARGSGDHHPGNRCR